jgi:hypothetical protein
MIKFHRRIFFLVKFNLSACRWWSLQFVLIPIGRIDTIILASLLCLSNKSRTGDLIKTQ